MFGFFWRWFGWSSPQQQDTGGGVCATVSLEPRVNATVTLTKRVNATVTLTPRVNATVTLEAC